MFWLKSIGPMTGMSPRIGIFQDRNTGALLRCRISAKTWLET
jgi:hypothetical protein